MPWFKVDDSLWGHPKWVGLPAGAKSLWVTAGSWSSDQLTDGFIPRRMLALFGAKVRDAEHLVSGQMWDKDGEDYRFHDWLVFQPSREAVEADRRADAARKAVGRNPELRAAIRERDGNACRYCGKAVHWTDKRGAIGGTYDHIDPNGPSDLDNLVVCCRGCNTAKGRRTPGQAGMKLKPIQIGVESAVESESGCPDGVHDPRPDPTRPDPTRILPTEESSVGKASGPPERTYPKDFEEFWSIYPKRRGKEAALKEWPKALKKASLEDILLGAKRYADEVRGKDQHYTKWPQGWLSAGMWADEPEQQQSSPQNRRYYGKPGERKAIY